MWLCTQCWHVLGCYSYLWWSLYLTYVTCWPEDSLWPCDLNLGGDLWLDGEEGEDRVYSGADEVVSGQERLHQDSDHQQENQHQVLWGKDYHSM